MMYPHRNAVTARSLTRKTGGRERGGVAAHLSSDLGNRKWKVFCRNTRRHMVRHDSFSPVMEDEADKVMPVCVKFQQTHCSPKVSVLLSFYLSMSWYVVACCTCYEKASYF